MFRLFQLLFLLLLAAVLYLGLRPSPGIVGTKLFPRWFATWFDHHDVLKNIIGFLALGLAGFLGWPRSRPLAIALAALVVMLEVIQIWMPHRFASLRDVLAGWAGLALAWLITWASFKVAEAGAAASGNLKPET
jgi:hypothetical protein